MLLVIAWKNVWRNRVRSMVIILAITVGLFGGVFSSAVMEGAFIQRKATALELEISDIQIHHPAFSDNYEMKYVLKDPVETDKKLSGNPGILSWCHRIKLTGMAATSSNSTGVIIYGVNTAQEKKVSKLWKTLADSGGTYLQEDKHNQVFIGKKLASSLKVKLRNKIVLTMQDESGNPVQAQFRVCGIYSTPNSLFDETSVFVKADDLRASLGLGENDCHEIALRVSDPGNVDNTAAALASAFPGHSVMTWKEISPAVGMMDDFMALSIFLFLGIIMAALGFGIINTMLMAVLERVREIGTLMAIGMNRKRIFLLIMLETIFLSLTGAFIGTALAAVLVYITGKTGLDLSSFAEGLESMGYDSIIYPAVGWKFYLGLAVLVIVTAVLASFYPAFKALKLKPAVAIRAD